MITDPAGVSAAHTAFLVEYTFLREYYDRTACSEVFICHVNVCTARATAFVTRDRFNEDLSKFCRYVLKIEYLHRIRLYLKLLYVENRYSITSNEMMLAIYYI